MDQASVIVQNTPRLAIYDMDRTVTVRGTYTPFLLFVGARMAPWRLVLAPLILIVMAGYGAKLISRKRLKEINMALLLGPRLSPHKIAPHIEAYADRVIATNLYAGARERIESDRAAGYRVALCTASYSLYVRAIAARLGIAPEDVIGTELKRDTAGDILAQIDGENCYDVAKLARIRAWIASLGHSREAVHLRCYSDHISDLPMLEMADEAFATTPSAPLRAVAVERGWRILDFN